MISDDWKSVGEYVAVKRPEYTCELQEFRRGSDQMMFIHLDMHHWTLTALKNCKHDFNLLREHVTCPLYACGEVDDEKWASFVKLFGFKFLLNTVCTDGKERRLFIHIKDDKKNVFKQQATNTVVSVVGKRPVVSSNPISDDSVQRRPVGAH